MNVSISPYSDASVYNMKFGVRLDKECLPLIERQILLARQLYNNIVACMRTAADGAAAYLTSQAGEEGAQLAAGIATLTAQFKEAKATQDEATMKRVAVERRNRWAAQRELFAKLRKANREVLNRDYWSKIGRSAGSETYQLRCKAVTEGLGWATANAVLDAALVAFKKSMEKGHAPRFSVGSLKQTDSLSLQFTQAGGVEAALVLQGKHNELKLLPPAKCARRQYGSFEFRLGPAAAEQMATGTWQYHREIPKDAFIPAVKLVRERVGKDYKWFLVLTIKTEPVAVRSGDSPKRLAAVHMGWAADDGGRRIAAIAQSADAGAARLIRLPEDIESQLRRVDEVESTRDLARDALVEKIKAVDTSTLPELVSADLVALKSLPASRISQSRLARAWMRWKNEVGIDGVPDWFTQWRGADRLLYQSSSHLSRNARMRRRTLYRNIAAEVAASCDVLAIEELDLKNAAKKVFESTGEVSEFSTRARSGRVVAALYEFVQALRWAMSKRGGVVLSLVGETATTCSHCGSTSTLSREEQPDHLSFICSSCGAQIDRKMNGAAVAWQLVHADIDAWVERAHTTFAEAITERDRKKAEKKTRISTARAMKRAA